MVTIPLDPPVRPETLSDQGLAEEDTAGAYATREALTEPRLPKRYTLLSVHGGGVVIKVEQSLPSWLQPMIDALAELLRLPPRWDSYQARPVSPRAVHQAIMLLTQVADYLTPPPQVVPMSSGGIQLEWHFPEIDLEVRPLSARQFAVSAEDFRTGEVWESERSWELARLTEWLKRLARHD